MCDDSSCVRGACNRLSVREIQLEAVALLKVFDELCARIGVRYSLFAGTLLGAARHEGFIPWDDDLDVCMPRPDYNRLLAAQHALPRGYSLLTPHNSELGVPYAKFVSHRVRVEEEHYRQSYPQYLWLDVFPLDGLPDGEQERDRLHRHAMRCISRLRISNGSVKRDALSVAFGKRLMLGLGGSRGAREAWFAFERHFLSSERYAASAEVGVLASCIRCNFHMPRAAVEEMTALSFEGLSVPVLPCWPALLEQLYGTWQELPPEEQRVSHGVEAWWAGEPGVES